LQLRDEQGLLDVWIELADELAGATVAPQCDGPEAFARQLPETLFRARHSFRVGNVELVPRVTRAIHNNLDSHFCAPFYSLKGQRKPHKWLMAIGLSLVVLCST
jgi:hypothetical protein